MKRSIIAALALLAVTVTALPALAHGNKAHEAQFPMPAAQFETRIDARVVRSREHMEKRIVEQKLTLEQAATERARFDGVVAQVSVEVHKAVADGTVTGDEAKAVREVAKGLGHGEHHRHARR